MMPKPRYLSGSTDEALNAREQADSETRRRKNRLAAGRRHFSRSVEQLAAAEGVKRDTAGNLK